MSYEALKVVHVARALISYALFLLRGIWRFTGSRAADKGGMEFQPYHVSREGSSRGVGLACGPWKSRFGDLPRGSQLSCTAMRGGKRAGVE